MKTKRELKCVQSLVDFNFVFNKIFINFVHRLAITSMPRFRAKPSSGTPQRFTSFWWALKAIQNNKLLRNNLAVNRHSISQSRHLMNGFTDDNHSMNEENRNNSKYDTNSGIDLTKNMNIASEETPKNDIKVIEIDTKKSLILMTNSETDYELNFGCLRITLLSDNFSLDLNGFTLTTDQSVEVMATFGHKIAIKLKSKGIDSNIDFNERLQTLGVQQIDSILNQMTENSCLILIERLFSSSLLYIENIPEFKPLNVKSDVWHDFKSVDNNYDYLKVWDKLFDELNFGDKDVIIVCGGQNVGKSSLIRYFINRHLSGKQSEGSNSSCLHLDCDPGQSEFNTAAQISLTQIEKPILSSTPTNVLNFKSKMSCSVGSNTATKGPKLYISSVNHLLNYFRNSMDSKGPLFVNTMGWTRDLGLALLTDIIKIAVPTHVIQIDSNVNNKVNFGFNLTPKPVLKSYGIQNLSLNDRVLNYKLSIVTTDNKTTKRTQLTRVSQQLTYFSRMSEIAFKPFFAMTPFKILWSNVFLHIVSDTALSSSLYLDILNCSWIQLCRIDEQNLKYSKFNDIQIIDSIEGNECLGSAVLRGIDFQNKCFYILSPEDPQVLESVNCIVRPFGLQIPEKMITEQLNYSSTSNLTYIYDNK